MHNTARTGPGERAGADSADRPKTGGRRTTGAPGPDGPGRGSEGREQKFDGTPEPNAPGRAPGGRSARRRGRVLAALAVLAALPPALHAHVPDGPGNLGSLLETFLPWTGLAVPVLLVPALLHRSALASAALLLPAAVWLAVFGPLLPPRGGGAHDLTVVQHNVADDNSDPAGTARSLAEAGPDVIALQELLPAALPAYREALAADHPYSAVRGTVGLWSRYPLTDIRRVDIKPEGIGPGWDRGLRSTVHTPRGEVAVYVAHLPSVRLGARGFASAPRDASAAALGAALAAEESERVVLTGDLNGTTDDRGLAPITSRLRPVHGAAGRGFGFTWPAAFPVARIDHVMVRGAVPVDAWSLPATGSDHLPVVARLRL